MDYCLENLQPDKFQLLCQALLARTFDKTQCFPIGQADGGRDAVAFFHAQNANEFVVFQVKFVRNPQADRDAHRKLFAAMEKEIGAITPQIPKGAKEYYLLTNVRGTSPDGTGAIDKVQNLLNDTVPIPSMCWWRDDINRRLDDAWDIKWVYPEILTGPDILRFLIESGLNEHKDRRSSAIRAYITDQFEKEKEVRFKQVELQNQLLDLFIDVPVDLRNTQALRKHSRRETFALQQLFGDMRLHFGERSRSEDEQSIGAATLLMDSITQQHLPRIVLEGAPGQGKSTVVQYVCQNHRRRLLGLDESDTRIPERHKSGPLRVPIKIDLRDLALWLNGKDPFSPEEAIRSADSPRTLESFLAQLISHFSGGAEFSVSDLHAVFRVSAVLLVADGLDEVAEISTRARVVAELSTGVNRLSSLANSLQTVVTSRPAAFANSPGLPEDQFVYLTLGSLTRPLVDEYAAKWISARRMQSREGKEIKSILQEKLDQPHLRDLARNAMQLAILLSLVHTRGVSLPDKRTALYDSYVELFFNREAEKSTTVRDHRNTLIEIHQFLAWTLHAESQTKQNRGSISSERLKEVVGDFLAQEEYDVSLVDTLFTGMVERVVALVSRIEGTYEFEVQPLREYFAARHLFDTAPYSPPGGERSGTLPDRFDVLARDQFWLNVTRFYAGCYSKGQLPSLVESIEELSKAPGYADTSIPQSLAATLLSDWVFAQNPKSMKKVVNVLLDGIGLRHTINATASRFNPAGGQLVLPANSGREELVAKCYDVLLNEEPPFDYAQIIVDVVSKNTRREACLEKWLEIAAGLSGKDLTRWIQYGVMLGAVSGVNVDKLREQCESDDSERDERIAILVRGGEKNVFEVNEQLFAGATDVALSRSDFMPGAFQRSGSLIHLLIRCSTPFFYAHAFESRDPQPLFASWRVRSSGRFYEELSKLPETPQFGLADACRDFLATVKQEIERTAREWATSIAPWNVVVEKGRACFGERWAMCALANAAAGIKSKTETWDTCDKLFDESQSLCGRVRYARLRSGNTSWWTETLEASSTAAQKTLALMIYFTWAGQSVWENTIDLASDLMDDVSQKQWRQIFWALNVSPQRFGQEPKGFETKTESLANLRSTRAIVAAATRLTEAQRFELLDKRLRNVVSDDPLFSQYALSLAVRRATKHPDTWPDMLPVIEQCYKSAGMLSDPYSGYMFSRAVQEGRQLPSSIATMVVRSCDKYPLELVVLAENVCRGQLSVKMRPVGEVAVAENWFKG